MMKKLCLIICCIILSSIVFCGCGAKETENQTSSRVFCGGSDFSVEAEDLGTSAEGSILAYRKDQDTVSIRIVSQIVVGKDDWGGVAFSLPAGFVVDEILCSYPGNRQQIDTDSLINILTTESTNEKYAMVIEIGRDRAFKATPGKGTITIDATCKISKDSDGAFTFGVECGASNENGTTIMGVSHEDVTVALNQ